MRLGTRLADCTRRLAIIDSFRAQPGNSQADIDRLQAQNKRIKDELLDIFADGCFVPPDGFDKHLIGDGGGGLA